MIKLSYHSKCAVTFQSINDPRFSLNDLSTNKQAVMTSSLELPVCFNEPKYENMSDRTHGYVCLTLMSTEISKTPQWELSLNASQTRFMA